MRALFAGFLSLSILGLMAAGCGHRKQAPHAPPPGPALSPARDAYGNKVYGEHLARVASKADLVPAILAAGFSPHGRYLASLDSCHWLVIRDFKTGLFVRLPSEGATSMAFSAMGDRLALAGPDRVRVLSLPEGRAAGEFSPPCATTLQSVAISSKGHLFASGSGPCWFEWDLATGNLLESRPTQESAYLADLQISRDDYFLSAKGRILWGWDLFRGLVSIQNPSNAAVEASDRLLRVDGQWALLRSARGGLSLHLEGDAGGLFSAEPGSGPLLRTRELESTSPPGRPRDIPSVRWLETTPDASMVVVLGWGSRNRNTWNAWLLGAPDHPSVRYTDADPTCVAVDESQGRVALGTGDGLVVLIQVF